jgi:type VI protein secretion system component VasF
MDHHEQHHQHHQKEREERIKNEKHREHKSDSGIRTIHPAWFVALGTVLIFLVIMTWILVASW